MKMQSELERVGAILRKSIPLAREAGFTVIPGRTFVLDKKRCCALGSVLVGKENSYYHAMEGCALELGIEIFDCLHIAKGFDSPVARDHVDGREWTELGSRLRREVESGLL